MDHVSMKSKLCRILAFVIIAGSLLLVGSICLAAALKFSESNNNLHAVVVTIAFIVLTLGAGSTAKQLSQMLEAMLPD